MQYPQIAEYAAIKNAPFSKPVVLAQATSRQTGREYRLWHHPAGYEPAGSMARWTNECWSVACIIDGTRHAQRFKTANEARKRFEQITSPH